MIVPTHRRPDLLPRALQSIKAIGDQVQIVLCADEGSVATRRVAAELLGENDIFLSLPGYRGPAATRNAGLRFATGDWISFLDDDDSYDPGIKDKILPALTNPGLAYFTNYRKVFEKRHADGTAELLRSTDKDTHRKPFDQLEVRNFIPLTALFIPRSAASRVSFDPGLEISEDWDFLLQLRRILTFQHLDHIGPNWHIEPDRKQSRNSGGRTKRRDSTLAVYSRYPPSSPAIEKGRDERMSELGIRKP